jgi:hypothetical protein
MTSTQRQWPRHPSRQSEQKCSANSVAVIIQPRSESRVDVHAAARSFESRAKPFRFDNDDRRRLCDAEASSEARVQTPSPFASPRRTDSVRKREAF